MADDVKELSSEDANLLARYRGAKPLAPSWFDAAIATPYEEHFVDVAGARIRYQSWGESRNPGLLLVHGNGAHAHWYDFIAPALAKDYRVIAMTFSGMGDSEWREAYSLDTFSAEQLGVCEDSGLFDGDRKPIIVAHSFGGFITLNTAAQHSDRFHGVMIVDSGIRPPEDEWEGPPKRDRGNRVYATDTAALARFRLAPPQPCENHYIVDYIARHSIKQVANAAGQSGWTWKFDPSIWQRFEGIGSPQDMLNAISCKLSLMRGENSVLIPERIWSYMRSLREDADMVSITDAQHHVMLDQPHAFIDAVTAQLQRWNY